MSEIQVGQINSTDGSTAITTGADGYVSFAKTQIGGRRNLIINGAMQVAQRGTSFGGNGYTLDRFSSYTSAGSLVRSVTQSPTAPSGFSSSLKIVATTPEPDFTGTEYALIRHPIEAQDLQQLDYGASEAKSVTLSFWVRSNVTGNYAITMYQDDAGKIIGSTYTISSANTWEQKTITFVGNTADVIANDNGTGLRLDWSLAAGSDRATTDNTAWGANATGNQAYGHTAQWGEATNDEWYLTGVQLEVGTVATPFEHRSFGEELALCQRYYYRWGYTDATSGEGTIPIQCYAIHPSGIDLWQGHPVEMRSRPSITTNGTWQTSNISSFSGRFQNRQGFSVRYVVSSTGNCYIYANSSDDYFDIDAEL